MVALIVPLLNLLFELYLVGIQLRYDILYPLVQYVVELL